MAHTYGNNSTHTSSAANPVTVSFTPTSGSTVLVLMMVIAGSTNRTGGTPTFNGVAMTQADTVQKAAASPETNVEMWYLLDPPITTANVSIPNAGVLTIWSVIATGKAGVGFTSAFDSASGGNGTSTNPSRNITTTVNGDIIFAVVGSGAQTWAPSARTGTQIFDTDNGTFGDGEQYLLQSTFGTQAIGWTFGTSEDWAEIAVAFKEVVIPLPPKVFGARPTLRPRIFAPSTARNR